MDNNNPQGRGNSRANQRGRGGKGKGQRPNNKQGSKPQNTGPKGAIEALHDHTYIVGDARQADKYNKTTEAIMAYIQTNFDRGQDVVIALEAMEDPDFDKSKPAPPEPIIEQTESSAPIYDSIEKDQYNMEYKAWMSRTEKYKINMDKVFGILWGQCTIGVKNKLESRKDWSTIKAKHKAIDLLKAIKEVTQDYQDSKYPLVSIKRSLLNVLTAKQDERESIVNYTKRFRNAVEIMEAQQGKLALTEYVKKMNGYDANSHSTFATTAYESFIAMCYVDGTNRAAVLNKDLSNAYAMGRD
jgi:hypothetical protein